MRFGLLGALDWLPSPAQFAGEGLGMGGAGPSTGLTWTHQDPKCTPSPTLFVGEGGTRVSAAG
jgi:hypothetical protein